jgi:hypothetical protein
MEALFPKDMEFLSKLAEEEPIIFVTRRDGKCPWQDTTQWLVSNGIKNPLVYVVRPGEEKGDVCKKLGIDVIIDDSPKYGEEILSHGHTLIMPIWEYNSKFIENNRKNRNLRTAETLGGALSMAKMISLQRSNN